MKHCEGHKADQGKARYDLIPPEALDGLATVLKMGAGKYGDRNWERGITFGRVFGATMRHLWAWWRGENIDPESGYSHLWHALCDIAFLLTYEARGMKDFDDRPTHHANGTGRNYLDSNSRSKATERSEAREGTASDIPKIKVRVV